MWSMVLLPFKIEFYFGALASDNLFMENINKGQYGVSGWFFVLYLVYIVALFAFSIAASDSKDDKIYIPRLKYLYTKKGFYFYNIDIKDKYVRVYKFDWLFFSNYDSYSLSSKVTSEHITKYLSKLGDDIDQENLSYVEEELSTYDRRKNNKHY